ncbi:uncharacterized protein F21D5.5 isoform X2 [Aphidius gifuensis]|uniref:uncharacterized protein F21D5.5 isoform X2 n=1 Tax=Aphidius gifuensis TaxID=684658 RepID=UPI001CDC8CFD|nr:uncharacterized protein F21D5.5 isoform X2 [Aphidius gifuensis]
MTSITSCYIFSDDKDYPSIYLPDGEVVSVGRTVYTKITDIKCSRKQVDLCACYDDCYVTVQQTGSNACGFNGAKIVKGQKYMAKHGDVIDVLYGKLKYNVEFKPPPSPQTDKCLEKPVSKKRTCIDSDSDDYDDGDVADNNYLKESPSAKKPRIEYFDDSKPTTSKAADDDEINQCQAQEKSTDDEMMDLSFEKIHEEGWEDIDNQALMIYTSAGVQSRSKIAAYDMDNTLITTQSGKVFPTDHNDWKLLMAEVPGKLKKLHALEYKIVIFTNQGGLGMGKSTPKEFKEKIERVVKKLSVPIQVYIATTRDYYRKPLTGMWDRLVSHNNDGVLIDKDKSFFVGDAAGRPKDWAPKKKKDHSLADRLLAMNIGIKFLTPEEHFLGQKQNKFEMPAFDPKTLNDNSNISDPPNAKLVSQKQEVIIMVGGPGTGKSHVATRYLNDYQHINRDKLGSWQKCVAAMEKALSLGKSVVVDNTNPDVLSRQRYIEVAKEKKIPVRCFLMTTSAEHAKHNNRFRELTDSTHTVVKDVIIHSYVKNFVPPTIDEGFEEIIKINFFPNFDTDKDRQLYQMYLLEK